MAQEFFLEKLYSFFFFFATFFAAFFFAMKITSPFFLLIAYRDHRTSPVYHRFTP